MASGIEMYKAVKAAIQSSQQNTEFKINCLDASDLMKLTYSDLIVLNFGEAVAEEVSTSLGHANLIPLGKTMGIEFKIDVDASSLLDN